MSFQLSALAFFGVFFQYRLRGDLPTLGTQAALLGTLHDRPRLNSQRCHVWLLVPFDRYAGSEAALEHLRLPSLFLVNHAGSEVAYFEGLHCVLSNQCVARDLTIQTADRLLPLVPVVVVRVILIEGLHNDVVIKIVVLFAEVHNNFFNLQDGAFSESKFRKYDPIDVFGTDLEL
mgnify:CR=1 FL=1